MEVFFKIYRRKWFNFFGRRYYDPEIGRWLTCDPSGFTDGLNLYVFVDNDPLTKVDLYGLYANPWMFPNSNTNYYPEKSEILPIIGNANSINLTYLINGQLNTKAEASQSAHVFYNNVKNVDNRIAIKPIYAATMNGLDFLLTVLQRLDFYEPKRVKMMREEFRNHANSLISNDIQSKSFIVSFSRGALDVFQALRGLNELQKKQYIALSAGFAKAIPKDFAFITRNVGSDGDGIPSFMDPFSCCGIERDGNLRFKRTERYNVEIIKSKNMKFPLNHSFQSKTYQDTLYEDFNILFPKYGAINDK